MAWLGAVAASALLAGCAPDISDTIVTAPQHVASGEGSALARVPSARIAIVEVEDKRGVPGPAGWIGERKTIGDISMGSVEISPPPADQIRSMLQAEFQRAGHQVVGSGAPVSIVGRLEAFRLTTPVTATYWDMTLNTSLAVEARGARNAVFRNSYRANCVERTYAWPGQTIIQLVVAECIGKLAGAVRNDERLAAFVGRK
jgi:uncharacterized lipoprotein YajG